jgi:hypothetical protein
MATNEKEVVVVDDQEEDSLEMEGNLVVDERLTEVQRNQENSVPARLARLEAEVFGAPEDFQEDEEPAKPNATKK